MDNKIDAVMIDTSAYHKYQCDFIGQNNSIIPKFLNLVKGNGIILLTSPVLEAEIKKHIYDSRLVLRMENCKEAIRKYKKELSYIGISAEEIILNLDKSTMGKTMEESFVRFYEEAYNVPKIEAMEIFDDYFAAVPPFSESGNKKSEFPDAFILKGLKQYCLNNPYKNVLVISDDTDWAKTLNGIKQITIKENLEDAIIILMEQVGHSKASLEIMFSEVEENIREEVHEKALEEYYNLNEYEIYDDVEIRNIKVVGFDDEIVPLDVSSKSALLQITANLSIDGSTIILDEERSIWDSEDRHYLLKEFTNFYFEEASAKVTCEVELRLPSNKNKLEAEIVSTKLINNYGIDLCLENAHIGEEKIIGTSEEEYYAEVAEAQEEFFKH